VRIFFRLTNPKCIYLIITRTEYTGWKYRLWRVCGNDEEGKLYLRHLSDLMTEEVVYICFNKYCKYKQQCKFNSEQVVFCNYGLILVCTFVDNQTCCKREIVHN
jgi:hypothetical protein